MVRSTTPAKDFMEASGWVWGPWLPVLRVKVGQPRRSAFEKRAKRLAVLAWHAEYHRRQRHRSEQAHHGA